VAGAQPDDQGPAEAGRPGERARAGGQAQQPPRGAPATGRGSGQTTGDRGGAQASKGEGGSGKAAESHQSARYAYWSGRFQEAERIYQELAEANPQNPDFPGELGNVFYAQGQWQKAADAYTRAALRLIEQGDYPRAHHLYRIVHGLDREKAAEIRDKLGQARKTSGG
jgi:tetratricopeptide (TPR) repeat protein